MTLVIFFLKQQSDIYRELCEKHNPIFIRAFVANNMSLEPD